MNTINDERLKEILSKPADPSYEELMANIYELNRRLNAPITDELREILKNEIQYIEEYIENKMSKGVK